MAAQGASAHEDTMQPSLRCVPISDSKYPKLLDVSIFDRYSQILRVIIAYSLTGLLQTLLLLEMSRWVKALQSGTE